MKKKILIIFGSIFLILLIIAIIAGLWTRNILNKEHDTNEVIKGSGDKTALIIYQPSNGHTAKNMANTIAETLADNDYTVTINMPSDTLNYDVRSYDLIVFGTPVYIGSVSSTLKDYVKANPVLDKDVILYVTGMLTDDHKEEEEMRTWFDKSNHIFTIKVGKGKQEQIQTFIENYLSK